MSSKRLLTGKKVAMMGSQGRQVPLMIREMARAQGLHTFSAGDQAILLRRHKDKTYKALVTVVRACWQGALGADMKPDRNAPRDVIYTVRSAAGGVLSVGITHLRPGGVLDRLALELELDDEINELAN